jgi:hypothetical protein
MCYTKRATPFRQLALTIYNMKKELEMEKGNTWKVKGKYV